MLDRSGDFYFLEMNARLQVEHPITEWVTGLDLVRAQLEVARGRPLGEAFDGVGPRGHAFEVRIYAEDPYRNFAPSPGRIRRLRWPDGPGVRVDAGVYEGDEVTIHYDPLLAKLTTWGGDREHALERLDRALAELRIEGIRTTVPLFQALLEDAEFRRGELDIEMLDRKLGAGELRAERPAELADLGAVAAAIEHVERTSRAAAVAPPASRDPTGGAQMKLMVEHQGRTDEVLVERRGDGWRVRVGDTDYQVDVAAVGDTARSLRIDGGQYEVDVAHLGRGRYEISRAGWIEELVVQDPLAWLARSVPASKSNPQKEMPSRSIC